MVHGIAGIPERYKNIAQVQLIECEMVRDAWYIFALPQTEPTVTRVGEPTRDFAAFLAAI